MKIQLGVEFEKQMSHAEKRACRFLLRPGVQDDSNDDDDDDDLMDFAAAARKDGKRKVAQLVDESKYIDCSFIMGSAAVVESLWSEQDNLLANKCRRGVFFF